MKLLLKIVLGLFGLLLAGGVALAVFLPMYFDPNDYKDEISAQVKAETGRDLAIPGDIQLSVFPWLGLELGQVSMSNAPGFGSESFAEIGSAKVRVKLMPLINKRIDLGRIELQGLAVRLAKDAQGRTNWDDIVERLEKPDESAPEPETQSSEEFKIEELQIEGVDITDAYIVWDDEQAGVNYKLEKFNLTTGTLVPGKPFVAQSSFNLNSKQPAMNAAVNLKSNVQADIEAQAYKLSDLQLQITAEGADIPKIKANLAGLVQADMKAQLIGVDGLRLKADVEGADVPTTQAEATGVVRINLATGLYRVEKLELDVTAEGEQIPGGKQSASALANVAFDMPKDRLQVSDLALAALGTNVSGHVDGYGMTKTPRFSGRLELPKANPRDIMKKLAIDDVKTADPKVLQSASLYSDFTATTDSVNLKNLGLKLDDSSIKGNASVQNFAKPAIGFDLSLDDMDVDRYLPPEEKAKAKTAESSGSDAGSANDTEIPVDAIKDINMNGRVQAGRLKVSNLVMTNADLKVTAQNGKLQIEPLTSNFYGGRVRMASTVDASKANPQYGLAARIDAVQAGPFLAALMGDETVTGLANIDLNLSSTGKTVGQIRKALDGTINMKFENGAVKGFNLGKMLRAAQAKLDGKTGVAEAEQTDFALLSATANITDGVLKNYDLNGLSPAFRIGGEGDVNLFAETLDYLAKVSVVKTSKGQGGETLDSLKGLTIPVKIQGSWHDPKIRIALDDALKDAAKQRLEEEKAAAKAELDARKAEEKAKLEAKKEEEEAKLKEKVSEKLDDKLKDLFKRD